MGGAIDIHAHIVLEAAFGHAGRYGPELATDDAGVPFFRIGEYVMKPMGYRGSLFMDLDKRLRAMDRDGIELQLLSPNPLTLYHGIEPDIAAGFCRVHNDAMAEVVARHPDRFLGGIALPMQDPDLAIAELHRARTELGLCAPYTGTEFGFELDDPRLDPFYEALVALDVPLFLHPTSNDGAGKPPARLRRYDLSLLFGYAIDETLAVAALILGGVTLRHPELDVCISHGGGTIGYLAEKFAFACDTRPWVPEHLRNGGFLRHLRRLWFDTHLDAPPALDLLVATVGADRCVFGTNYGGWDSGGAHAHDPFTLSLNANARRLLRLAPEV
ncbi:MAG: amidohydrolase family protein [Acidimicrobiales bacterium]